MLLAVPAVAAILLGGMFPYAPFHAPKALPLGREALRDRVDRALHAVLADGRCDAIGARFFPFRVC